MHQDHDTGHDEAGTPWLDRVNDAYYNRLGDRMGRRTRDRINWMCAACVGDSALDVGCSQGITSILLGREGFRVLGIDVMQEAIDRARHELTAEPDEVQARVRFERTDLASMAAEVLYDNVIVGEVVEHQTNPTRFLRAAMRHIAPGGRMVVTVPFGLHPFPDHKCTVFPRGLVEAFGDELRIATMDVADGYVRMVAVRDLEAGTSGVVDMRDMVAVVTEAGTVDAQAQYFELTESSKRAESKRKELVEQVKALHARNRELERAGEQQQATLREELVQLKSQLLVLRNESLSAARGAEEVSSRLSIEAQKVQELSKREAAWLAERDDQRRQLAQLSAEVVEERNKLELTSNRCKGLEQELARLSAERVAQDEQLTRISVDRDALSAKCESLEQELVQTSAECAAQVEQLAHISIERDSLMGQVETARQSEQEQAEQARKTLKIARERDARQRQLKRKVDQLLDYRRRLEHQHKTVKSWLDDANAELRFLHESVSLRLGITLVSALRSPRDFVATPMRLGRLFASGLQRRAARRLVSPPVGEGKEADPAGAPQDKPGAGRALGTKHKKAKPAADPLLPVCELQPVALPMSRGGATVLPLVDSVHALATPRTPFPDFTRDVRVAAIMDDFTRESFRHTCQLLQLTPDSWQAQMEEFRPHLVMVESAWRGEGGSWTQKIYPLSRELSELVAWARAQGIPTVFWNKEDPVHFSVFLSTARLFDHVFTTDIDCIKSYRRELGHERVHLLPFACEPWTNNPVEAYAREDGFCFAGSYYAKYPERQRDFASLVDALRGLRKVDIFDRNHGKDEPSLAFPDAYRELIRGNLPYDQIGRAYKGYRYGININTVKQSQSMFARRAFDLLASNTVTVSNFSRGLRLLFGDLVISTDSGEEAAQRLSPLLADDAAYRRFRLQGLRKVMGEHTYEDRLNLVLERVSGATRANALPQVVVLAEAATASDFTRVLAAYDRQAYARRRLVVVMESSIAGAAGDRADVQILDIKAAGQLDVAMAFQGSWIAGFDPGDYYGRNYLSDLVLATRYSEAQALGKAAHYVVDGSGAPRLQGDGNQYAIAELPLRACVTQAGAFTGEKVSTVAAAIASGTAPVQGLALDEFNYCRQWAGDACEAVDDLVLHIGIGIDRLQQMAAMGGDEAEAASGATLRGLGPDQFERLFPPGSYADGRVVVSRQGEGIELASSLGEGKHAYVYASELLSVNELFPDAIGRFNMQVSAENLISVTLIFLDAQQRRVGYVIRACNSNQSVVPVEGTCYVKLGMRVQGAGLASMRQLVLQHVPPDINAIVGAGRHLVISRGYPGYNNLYSYSFVHRRLLGYRAAGLGVDVFRLSGAPLSYEEFEGVDVTSGNAADLALMLRSNGYETILVHSFDEQVWSAISPLLNQIRVVVWVHGAEIQPWYRRDFSFSSDDDRRRGIQRSNMRMNLWRQVLGDMPSNLHLVFVSKQLAQQALRDLDVEIPESQYSVIHNLVDGDFFTYVEKPVEQRHKVLSIRPYTKTTYANDLTVKAILDLASEPWFDQLQFRIVGDGPMFDQIVEPLRSFNNVILQQGFLTQRGVRALHHEHGVFLVPSRIDSQGVSRDEAMASGLVPVTNGVAAIPEFVDDNVGFLAAAEDWRGLADAIRTLHTEPDTFQRMSRAAAQHVRVLSGPGQTLEREVALIRSGLVDAGEASLPVARPRRIAVYGDLNLNLIDGSAVWAASLVQVLAGLDNVEVDLFLKARLRSTCVLAEVLNLPNVRLVEPGSGGDTVSMAPRDAVAALVEADSRKHYSAVVLRGFQLCQEAAGSVLSGRLWTYLTDIPQQPELLDVATRDALARIADASQYVLCQTGDLEQLLEAHVPAMRGRTRRLPPMVPPLPTKQVADAPPGGLEQPLRIVYAGKFAPRWGIREMLDVADELTARGIAFEWHVFGDKIHNPSDDPDFRDEVKRRLQETPGLIWHRGVTRDKLLSLLPTMHLGWAWRHPSLEDTTLELSTKVLEYGLCGLPVLMAPSPVNRATFGEDYPLFARASADVVDLLAGAVAERMSTARVRLQVAASAHTFDAVRSQWVSGLLDQSPVPEMKSE